VPPPHVSQRRGETPERKEAQMRSARTRSLSIAVLTAAIVLLLSAASAAAATIPIQGGEVDWGIKESFRNYVKGPIAGGQIEVSGGAAEAADGTFRFPVGSGTYDTTTHVTEVQGAGTVHFTGHFSGGVPALDLTFSDPRVIVGQTSVVYADVVTKSLATGEIEEFPDAEFALLDASGVMPEFSEEAVMLKDMPAELTAEGAEAFAGFYTEGEELDPLSLTAAFNPTPPVEEPKQEEPKAADPKPAETPAPAPAPVAAMPMLKSSGGTAKLGGGGSATLVTVTCPSTEPCSLQAPKSVKLKIGDKWFSAKVIAPKWILAGKSAKVTVKLSRAALEELGDGKTKIGVKLVLGSGSQSTTKVVKAMLKSAGKR
jgi:Htaa protein